MKRGTILKKKYLLGGLAASFIASAVFWIYLAIPARTSDNKPAEDKPSTGAARQVQINLDKAIEVALPNISEDLKATPFKTSDNKQGWVIRIPGGHPIATPAYADGMVFIGGGYGSHEFYAFDSQTGKLVWQTKTSDDGPTAAVVEDGYVAFNTESCTVIVCEAKTGKVVWQEWLGDPLMSQPAISKGRLYIAYPAGQRGAQQNSQNQQVASTGRGTGHRLLCADLKTGRHIWEQQITGDVISAPVVHGEQIYFTCFDGTSFCLNASNGTVVWRKNNSGTSAPVIANGQVVLTQKEKRGDKDYEGVKRIDALRGEEKDKKLLAEGEAGYLGENRGGGVGISETVQVTADAAVGFSSAPQAAQLDAANKHIGVKTVVGGWAYQGSRVAYNQGQMINAQGRYLNCMRAIDGRFNWRAEVKGAGIDKDSQVFSPPALGKLNLYLCSSQGHLISVSQKGGEAGFMYFLKQPMAFQPALAHGNIYIGTVNGLLICLKTGEKDADGWYGWGGNAQHNK